MQVPTLQQTLLSLSVQAQSVNQPPPPLESTWKDTRLIDAQTTKTPAPGVMIFRIMHRFGDMGQESNGGIHTLYGFDEVTDIYLGFEFGILKNLSAGFGRSKEQELLDVSIKYRPLTQNSTGMPISLAIYEDAAITPQLNSTFYGGGSDTSASQQSITDRLSYITELLIDRKFGNICSLELITGLSHRNYVLALTNPGNHSRDSNNIAYAAAAGRIKLSKHASLVFDYYYIMSPYRTNNPVTAYHNCLSAGYEIETGGHVFQITLSNGSFINENNMIPMTTDSWAKGGFKLGFSISRAFNI
ncbi:MAG: DUF5777 family beta-barrel protein [Bacteroidia bacterium]